LNDSPLLETHDLVKHYPVMERGLFQRKQIGVVKSVDHVSLAMSRGETLGLVGETGCGKTTLARTILYLIQPTSGQVFLKGRDISEIFRSRNRNEFLKLRRSMQLIFQDPYLSLNPRWTVANIITEAFRVHKHVPQSEWTSSLMRLLKLVGLDEYHAYKYPHEFSGGQRQRIGIARALAVEPEFIVCDEPVSSLDVSVRSQILNLLVELREKLNLTYLYISHDLSTVWHICNRVAVMYLGRMVEWGDVDELFYSPLHPYTKILMAAMPIADPKVQKESFTLAGEVPSAINPPSGCRFHTRCPIAQTYCKERDPELRQVGTNHMVACHEV